MSPILKIIKLDKLKESLIYVTNILRMDHYEHYKWTPDTSEYVINLSYDLHLTMLNLCKWIVWKVVILINLFIYSFINFQISELLVCNIG